MAENIVIGLALAVGASVWIYAMKRWTFLIGLSIGWIPAGIAAWTIFISLALLFNF
jgi:hypothetical protein